MPSFEISVIINIQYLNFSKEIHFSVLIDVRPMGCFFAGPSVNNGLGAGNNGLNTGISGLNKGNSGLRTESNGLSTSSNRPEIVSKPPSDNGPTATDDPGRRNSLPTQVEDKTKGKNENDSDNEITTGGAITSAAGGVTEGLPLPKFCKFVKCEISGRQNNICCRQRGGGGSGGVVGGSGDDVGGKPTTASFPGRFETTQRTTRTSTTTETTTITTTTAGNSTTTTTMTTTTAAPETTTEIITTSLTIATPEDSGSVQPVATAATEVFSTPAVTAEESITNPAPSVTAAASEAPITNATPAMTAVTTEVLTTVPTPAVATEVPGPNPTLLTTPATTEVPPATDPPFVAPAATSEVPATDPNPAVSADRFPTSLSEAVLLESVLTQKQSSVSRTEQELEATAGVPLNNLPAAPATDTAIVASATLQLETTSSALHQDSQPTETFPGLGQASSEETSLELSSTTGSSAVGLVEEAARQTEVQASQEAIFPSSREAVGQTTVVADVLTAQLDSVQTTQQTLVQTSPPAVVQPGLEADTSSSHPNVESSAVETEHVAGVQISQPRDDAASQTTHQQIAEDDYVYHSVTALNITEDYEDYYFNGQLQQNRQEATASPSQGSQRLTGGPAAAVSDLAAGDFQPSPELGQSLRLGVWAEARTSSTEDSLQPNSEALGDQTASPQGSTR